MSRRLPVVSGLLSIGLILCGCAAQPSTPDTALSSAPTTAPVTTPTPDRSTSFPTASPSAPSPAPVDVSIATFGARNGSVYATAIVPGLVEDGGDCTLTARQGDAVRTTTIPAVRATEATNCGVMSVPADSGDWSVTVSYRSVAATGVSAVQIVTAP